MANELGLLVPGVRSSGNTDKMAWKLGTRTLKKRKPMDYRHKGERQKTIAREMLLRYAICPGWFGSMGTTSACGLKAPKYYSGQGNMPGCGLDPQ